MKVSWKSFKNIVDFENHKFYVACVSSDKQDKEGLELRGADPESVEWLRDDANYDKLWKHLSEEYK
jgi:hypothetical protein